MITTRDKVLHIACWLGIATIISSLLTILLSITLNPWFDLFNDALSDMGRVGLDTAYIFNSGLAITSLLGMGHAYCLAHTFRNRLGVFSAGVYWVCASLLLFVAVFPEGTRLHWIISYGFFLLMDVALVLFGFALWSNGLKVHGAASVILSFTALLGSVLIKWPSMAILELFNIAIYYVWYILMFSVIRTLTICRGPNHQSICIMKL